MYTRQVFIVAGLVLPILTAPLPTTKISLDDRASLLGDGVSPFRQRDLGTPESLSTSGLAIGDDEVSIERRLVVQEEDPSFGRRGVFQSGDDGNALGRRDVSQVDGGNSFGRRDVSQFEDGNSSGRR